MAPVICCSSLTNSLPRCLNWRGALFWRVTCVPELLAVLLQAEGGDAAYRRSWRAPNSIPRRPTPDGLEDDRVRDDRRPVRSPAAARVVGDALSSATAYLLGSRDAMGLSSTRPGQHSRTGDDGIAWRRFCWFGRHKTLDTRATGTVESQQKMTRRVEQ